MRLPGHADHDVAECDACAVFDQVHAERDDLRIRVAQLTHKSPAHKARIADGVRDFWASEAGQKARENRRERARTKKLKRLQRLQGADR